MTNCAKAHKTELRAKKSHFRPTILLFTLQMKSGQCSLQQKTKPKAQNQTTNANRKVRATIMRSEFRSHLPAHYHIARRRGNKSSPKRDFNIFLPFLLFFLFWYSISQQPETRCMYRIAERVPSTCS